MERQTQPGRGQGTEAPGSASAPGTSLQPPGARSWRPTQASTQSVCSGRWERPAELPPAAQSCFPGCGLDDIFSNLFNKHGMRTTLFG